MGDRPRAGAGAVLGAHDLHVWLADPDAIRDPRLLAAYDELMSEEERRRQRRFRFERERHQFLVTRALARTTLSRYAGRPPRAWRFRHNEYGRPALAGAQTALDLRFNLSHTRGLIACAVTLGREVGVDVEAADRRGETVAIADRYFSAREVRDLHAQPAAARQQRFFELWTLKEAYIKARGMSLDLPLASFSFELSSADAIRIDFDPRIADHPASWQFRLFRPTPRHVLAVAARRPAGAELAIELHRVVPLAGAGAATGR